MFSRAEIATLQQRSNLHGVLAVSFTWTVIALCFVLLAWAQHQPLVVAVPCFLMAWIVLGGRHLALAILHHEAAHKTLFRNIKLNDCVGQWLCAWPGWNDLHRYRPHHLAHHLRTNQAKDPDLSLVTPFPTSQASLRRKLLRDLVGITGVKALFGKTLMDAGLLRWTVASDVVPIARGDRSLATLLKTFLRNAAGTLCFNALLLALLTLLGEPWIFAMWMFAYITPFPLFLRIRSMAEHACTGSGKHAFENTRTVRAGFFARATVAPIRVNFHIEHHLLPSVPHHNLPALHRMLRERYWSEAPPSYTDVLRQVSSPN